MSRHKLIQYHGDNLMTVECPDGHRRRCLCIPKKRGIPQVSETAIKKLVSYWWNTGVTMKCPKCRI